uniref:Death domain-containing protein n=1 Tax=Amphimedon queenslandica TaxID=400682 RepID=A0A1X7U874_AMPQE
MSFIPTLLLFSLQLIYLAEGLNIRDLDNVIQNLEDAQFNTADWDKLGRKLGLHKNTLDVISVNERGDVDRCFTECLVKWLSRADDVDSKCNGKPSYSSLADALDQMKNNKHQADYIRGLSRGKKPAKRRKLDPASTKKCGSEYKYNDGESEACAADEETDGPPQDLPDWQYDDKIINRVPETQEFHKDLVKDIEILLMPATTSEEDLVVYYLKKSSKKVIETYIDGLRIYIGHYGKSKVIVVMTAPDKSRQGPIHAGVITSKMLEKFLRIKYVVAVGVCFGMDPGKQKLGDVIISGTICDFTNKREGLGENEYQRGPQHQVKPAILNKFRPTHGFEMPHNITVSTGVLISTGSLIDNPDVKKKLLDQKPDAIAGEMEGAGIMTAIDYAPERGVSAIVIKGIGDWGDGDKEATKKWKPFAARAAAHYVYAVLNK